MRAVIFDIDGTLVQSHELDAECYCEAVRSVLGNVAIREDWNAYPLVTDEGIFRTIVADNGLGGAGSAAVAQRFGELLAARLRADPAICRPVAGAAKLLSRLRAAPGVRIGFATGGWRHTAQMKLDHAGIDHAGVPMRTSNDSPDRVEIMEACRAAIGCPGEAVTYVGDGEWDLRATRALGWRLVGVGPRLEGRTDPWVPDFGDGQVESAFGGLLRSSGSLR